jgi:elongation factor G
MQQRDGRGKAMLMSLSRLLRRRVRHRRPDNSDPWDSRHVEGQDWLVVGGRPCITTMTSARRPAPGLLPGGATGCGRGRRSHTTRTDKVSKRRGRSLAARTPPLYTGLGNPGEHRAMTFAPEDLRTIALVGPAGSGKTSLIESLLHRAGAIGSPGSIERGSTVCDFDPLEKQHRHSIRSAVAHLEWLGARVHMLDTPGTPDFVGEALCALEAVETAVLVVNAQYGIDPVARRIMQWAEQRRLCRMIVINKIDADNVDLPGLVATIQESFGKQCLPINLPASGGRQVVDCFFNPAGASDFSSVEAAHQALIDQVVEVDEALMAAYLEKGEVAPEELHAPFEAALREGHLVPVCFVSARNGTGVQELLDVIVRLMPNPAEGNPPPFLKGEGTEAQAMQAVPDASRHVLAHVFKVVVDPYVGKLGVFRIHQGTVTRDTQLFIGDGRKPFKVGHLLMLQGKDHIEIAKAGPGDIAAVAKIEDISLDCVLHDSHDEDHIHLSPVELPEPMFGLAVAPKRRGDEQRISEVLHKIAAEDPCFRVEHSAATHETVIRGLGELHLRMVLEKMAAQYHVEVDTKPPRIPYRETIGGKAEGHHRHKKQTGGAGQFGEVFLRVEPLPRSTGFQFVDEVKGGAIPTQFIPAVEKGIHQVLACGPIGGFKVEDVKVTVYDGKHHAVDSKEVAFITAGKRAFLDAMAKAHPMLLEPVVDIHITAPEQCMGDIAGDLSSRRGQVNGTDALSGGLIVVFGKVPLSELGNYQSRLKSVTGGQGSYTIAFSHYDPVPPAVQQQIAAEHRSIHGDED